MSVKGRERRKRFLEREHPRVLSRSSQEPREWVPDTGELVVARFGQVCAYTCV